jgi:hypothetical protein
VEVVDLGPAQLLDDRTETPSCLLVAENGLTQHVHVEPNALRPPSCRVGGEGALLGGKDDTGELAAKSRDDGGHHRAREPRHGAGEAQRQSIERTGEAGHSPGADEIVEPPGGARRITEAHDLVGELEDEGLAGGVVEEAAHPPPFVAVVVVAGPYEELFGQLFCPAPSMRVRPHDQSPSPLLEPPLFG